MNAFMISVDGNNFCHCMTPNFAQPFCFAHFHLELLGTCVFGFSGTDTWHWDMPNPLALGQPNPQTPETCTSLLRAPHLSTLWLGVD